MPGLVLHPAAAWLSLCWGPRPLPTAGAWSLSPSGKSPSLLAASAPVSCPQPEPASRCSTAGPRPRSRAPGLTPARQEPPWGGCAHHFTCSPQLPGPFFLAVHPVPPRPTRSVPAPRSSAQVPRARSAIYGQRDRGFPGKNARTGASFGC